MWLYPASAVILSAGSASPCGGRRLSRPGRGRKLRARGVTTDGGRPECCGPLVALLRDICSDAICRPQHCYETLVATA